MTVKHMKFAYTDPGFCRVYYKHERRLYCVQEEGRGLYEFYSCTADGEPSHPVSIEGRVFDPIPEPDEYDVGFMAFLRDKGVLLEGAIS